jgi:hypothetical protein
MKKMHAISGNKRFMAKRAMPLLKKHGITKTRANLIGGDILELRFLIDDAKLELIDNELKKINKIAYSGITEGIKKMKLTKSKLKEMIREELNELKPGESSHSEYKKIHKMLDQTRDIIDKLVKIGEDYSVFQNAKASSKALKQIQKLLRNVQ